MQIITSGNECTGCAACMNACTKGAITMKPQGRFGHLFPVRSDRASFDEQHQGIRGCHGGSRHLSRAPHGGGGSHVRGSGHQECTVSLSLMAAGCLWLLHGIQCCDSVLTGFQRIYLSVNQDLLPRGRF